MLCFVCVFCVLCSKKNRTFLFCEKIIFFFFNNVLQGLHQTVIIIKTARSSLVLLFLFLLLLFLLVLVVVLLFGLVLECQLGVGGSFVVAGARERNHGRSERHRHIDPLGQAVVTSFGNKAKMVREGKNKREKINRE